MSISKFLLPAVLILQFSVTAYTQESQTEFNSREEVLTNLIQYYDKGFIGMGYEYTNNNQDMYSCLAKTDVNGKVLWKKSIGDPNCITFLGEIASTSDGGLVAAGTTNKYNAKHQPLFIKFNACGQIEWSKVIQIPDQYFKEGVDIVQLPDGSIKGLASYRRLPPVPEESATLILTFSADGQDVVVDTLRYLSGEKYTAAIGHKIVLSEDSNILITAVPNFNLSWGIWFKINADARILWEQSSFGEIDVADTKSDFSGHFYAAGLHYGYGTIMLKYHDDTAGEIWNSWENGSVGSPVTLCCYNTSVILAAFRGILNGSSTSNWISVIDSSGTSLHNHLVEAVGSYSHNILKTSDNKILFTEDINTAEDSISFFKYEYCGAPDYLLPSAQDLNSYTYDSLCPTAITSDTISIEAEVIVGVQDNKPGILNYNELSVWPVPAMEQINIGFNGKIEKNDHLMVYGIKGNIISEIRLNEGAAKLVLDISTYPQGYYILNLKRSDSIIAVGKFIR